MPRQAPASPTATSCAASVLRTGVVIAARTSLAAALLLAAAMAPTMAQDTRAIQIREVLRTDERTFAYFARFRDALTARFGTDPLLSMLVFGEQEGQALVHAAPGAPAEHVIFQNGQWIATDGRQLKPWAPGAGADIARFRLSAVHDALLRDKFRAHRAQPRQAADHLGEVKIGYFGAPFNRQIVEVTVASMIPFGLSVIAFDLTTGQALDVNAAIADIREQRAAEQRKDADAQRKARNDPATPRAPMHQ